MIDIIKQRRSIRSYLPEQIKEAELAVVLEAAAYAPSGHNSQPWHFTVIQNKELLNFISRRTKEIMLASPLDKARRFGASEKFHLFYHAPTVIIVSGNSEAKSPWNCPAMSSSPIRRWRTARPRLKICCWRRKASAWEAAG